MDGPGKPLRLQDDDVAKGVVVREVDDLAEVVQEAGKRVCLFVAQALGTLPSPKNRSFASYWASASLRLRR